MAWDPQQTLSSCWQNEHGEQRDEVSQEGLRETVAQNPLASCVIGSWIHPSAWQREEGFLPKQAGEKLLHFRGPWDVLPGAWDVPPPRHRATSPHLHSSSSCHPSSAPIPSSPPPPHVTHQETKPKNLIQSESQDTCPVCLTPSLSIFYLTRAAFVNQQYTWPELLGV